MAFTTPGMLPAGAAMCGPPTLAPGAGFAALPLTPTGVLALAPQPPFLGWGLGPDQDGLYISEEAEAAGAVATSRARSGS